MQGHWNIRQTLQINVEEIARYAANDSLMTDDEN